MATAYVCGLAALKLRCRPRYTVPKLGCKGRCYCICARKKLPFMHIWNNFRLANTALDFQLHHHHFRRSPTLPPTSSYEQQNRNVPPGRACHLQISARFLGQTSRTRCKDGCRSGPQKNPIQRLEASDQSLGTGDIDRETSRDIRNQEIKP